MSFQQGASGFPEGTPKYPADSLSAQLMCGGRLSLSATLPVPTADITATSAVYLLPYEGGAAPVYTRTGWCLRPFAAQTFTLAGLTADTNYDFFDVPSGDGTLTCELAPAWASDTARATTADVVDQDGHKLNASGFTGLLSGRSVYPGVGRLRGTIRVTAATTTEDTGSSNGATGTVGKRFLWNAYNRVERTITVVDTTNTWSYQTDAYQQARATAANKGEFVIGLAGDAVKAEAIAYAANSTAILTIGVGVGVDSTTANSAQLIVGVTPAINAANHGRAIYSGYPAIGHHYLAWLERSSVTAGTTTWVGDSGSTIRQTGMRIQVRA